MRLTRAPQETLTGVTNERGAVLMIPFGDGWFRAIAWDRLREQAPLNEPVTIDEIRDSFHRIAGDDFGMTEMRWSSRFLSERKQARALPGRPGVHRRRRRARAFAARRAGHEHRHRRCDEPGLEARRGGARDGAGLAAGQLSRASAFPSARRCSG